MAAKLLLADEEEGYIDMEITSFSTFLLSHNNHSSSSPSSRPSDFEFQMCSSIFPDMEASSSSPADDLFFHGMLLPLNLQNFTSLNHNEEDYAIPVNFDSVIPDSSLGSKDSSLNEKDYVFEEFYGTPLTSTTVTPFESCNVSPSESFRISGKLNPEDYDFKSTRNSTSGFFSDEKNQKKTRKQVKQYSSLGSKLRAWIGKASCKYELAYVTKVADEGSASKACRESLNYKQHVSVGKKNPFGQIHRSGRFHSCNYASRMYEEKVSELRSSDDTACENGSDRQRRPSGNSKSLLNGLSSFSVVPNKSYGCEEMGNSILGAIAHCKESQSQSQSQQYFN